MGSKKRQYASATERKRAQRARDRAGRAHRLDARPPAVVALVDHSDPVSALAEWSRKTLVVPPGHPRSGEPLELLPFAIDWLRETWDAHESALSTARKNAKVRSPRWWRSAIWSDRCGVPGGAAPSRASAKKRRASYAGKSPRLRRSSGLDVQG